MSTFNHKAIISSLFCVTLLSVIPVSTALSAEEITGQSTPVLAVWGEQHRVMADDYRDWLAVMGFTDSENALKEYIFVHDLADQAIERGVDRQAAIQMEMAIARIRVLGDALKDRMDNSIQIADTEIAAYLQGNPKAFHRPGKRLLRDIFMTLPEDPEQARIVRQRMQEIREELDKGADFKQMARTESQSQTRFRDGLMGRVALSELPATVAEAVAELQPGMMSEVIEHNDGLMILYCERIDDAVTPDLEEQRVLTRRKLHRERMKRSWTALEERLRREGASGVVLSEHEMAGLFELRFPSLDKSDITAAHREKVVSEWTRGKLLADYAISEGLDKRPEVMRSLRWLPTRILAKHELSDQVRKRFHEPQPRELAGLYEKNKKRYRSFPQYKLAAIYFGKAEEAVVQQAWDVIGRIDHDRTTFEEAAREYSKHPSAGAGGLLGWVSLGKMFQWDIIVMKAIRQLSPGENSGLLRTATGIWVYQLKEKLEGRQLSFEEAQDTVRKDWSMQRVKELEDEIRQAAYLSLDIRRTGD